MIAIGNTFVSDELITEQFVCDLKACKGACCWEGDMGAPVDSDEILQLEQGYEKIKPFLSPAGIAAIEENGVATFYEKEAEFGTSLINNRECAFMTYSPLGIAQCGIEQAEAAGAIDFQKPISCHLYPVRITAHDNYDAINYDRWDICSAACSLGKKEKMPVYKFVKNALLRKYGSEFYEELDQVATYIQSKKD